MRGKRILLGGCGGIALLVLFVFLVEVAEQWQSAGAVEELRMLHKALASAHRIYKMSEGLLSGEFALHLYCG